jgi:nicotinate-nucleotide adenylyltransferase
LTARTQRYGIFGGTFDPPHIGHLILAAEAYQQLSLKRVLWVLTPAPPHKREQEITPSAARLAMLRAALGDDPAFELSGVDIDRPPPHYAADTMALLRAQMRAGCLYYLMGEDSLDDLPSWHAPARFLALCDGLGVMRRPRREVDLEALETQLPGVRAKLNFIQAPLLEISSTEIRGRVRQGRPYRYYLPPGVYEIVRSERLYLSD